MADAELRGVVESGVGEQPRAVKYVLYSALASIPSFHWAFVILISLNLFREE